MFLTLIGFGWCSLRVVLFKNYVVIKKQVWLKDRYFILLQLVAGDRNDLRMVRKVRNIVTNIRCLWLSSPWKYLIYREELYTLRRKRLKGETKLYISTSLFRGYPLIRKCTYRVTNIHTNFAPKYHISNAYTKNLRLTIC